MEPNKEIEKKDDIEEQVIENLSPEIKSAFEDIIKIAPLFIKSSDESTQKASILIAEQLQSLLGQESTGPISRLIQSILSSQNY